MKRRRIHATAVLAALCLLSLAACGGGGGGGGSSVPAFYVASTTPLDGAFGVSRDPTVVVYFNTTLDESSVGDAALVVTAGGTEIEGTLSVGHGADYDTLRWWPQRDLDSATLHTLTLDPGLRSSTQQPLGGSTTFTFVTTSGGGALGLPTADQMRPALGQLTIGRQAHAATLLADGRVLITGGFTLGAATTDSAEIYLEGLESFQELTARLQVARASHTATRLSDGRVLLTGGWIQAAGGGSATTATAEIFNPATNTFAATGSMLSERADHAALRLPDGRVLITGGSRLVGSFLEDLASAEIFDPGTGTFAPLGESMTHTRTTHGMVDNGQGRIVLAGGSDADPRHDWYDIASGGFEDLGAGANDRGRFGPAVAAFASGRVVIAGGDLLGTVMTVDTEGNVLNTGSALNVPRSYATAVRIAPGQVLVAGGIDFSNGGFVESSCDVVVEGGLGGGNTYPAEVRLGTGMVHHTATVLASGNVLLCGGLNEDGAEPNKRAAMLFFVR